MEDLKDQKEHLKWGLNIFQQWLSNRLIRALLHDSQAHMKRKMWRLNLKKYNADQSGSLNTRKYCQRKNQISNVVIQDAVLRMIWSYKNVN